MQLLKKQNGIWHSVIGLVVLLDKKQNLLICKKASNCPTGVLKYVWNQLCFNSSAKKPDSLKALRMSCQNFVNLLSGLKSFHLNIWHFCVVSSLSIRCAKAFNLYKSVRMATWRAEESPRCHPSLYGVLCVGGMV